MPFSSTETIHTMTLRARSVSLSRWSHPVAALMLIGASATVSHVADADPGDFGAMPGLWKITLHTVKGGRDGGELVKWKCLYDGGDPWSTFVDVMAPVPGCERSHEHRTSTMLAWQVDCGGRAGHGRITLDSAQHYAGNVALDGHDALKVEGKRYAACTSPSD
jgi:hypothetical protein